jgi:hypothetical protein
MSVFPVKGYIHESNNKLRPIIGHLKEQIDEKDSDQQYNQSKIDSTTMNQNKILVLNTSGPMTKYDGLILMTSDLSKKKIYLKKITSLKFAFKINSEINFNQMKVIQINFKSVLWSFNIMPNDFDVISEIDFQNQIHRFNINLFKDINWNLTGTYITNSHIHKCKPADNHLLKFKDNLSDLKTDPRYLIVLDGMKHFLTEMTILCVFQNEWFSISQSVYCLPFGSFNTAGHKSLSCYQNEYEWLFRHIMSLKRSSRIICSHSMIGKINILPQIMTTEIVNAEIVEGGEIIEEETKSDKMIIDNRFPAFSSLISNKKTFNNRSPDKIRIPPVSILLEEIPLELRF